MERDSFRLTRLWLTDSGLTALLIFLVVVVFVLHPLNEFGAIGQFIIAVFFSLVLISGAVAVARSRVIVFIVGALVLCNVIIHWTRVVTPSPTTGILDAIVSMLSCAILAALMLAQVLREGPITIHRVQGAVAVYLLLGLVWTFAYQAVDLRQPGAFTGLRPESQGGNISAQLGYFSFVCLTTMGFGDITATHSVARSLVMLEGLIGQLFPVLLIARLVSMELYYRQREASRRERRRARQDAAATSERVDTGDSRRAAKGEGERGR